MSDFLDRIKDLSPKRLALLADELQSRLNAMEQASTEAIAVIGIGCRFPGGVTDPESYWQLLKTGKHPITPVPPERWDVDEFYDPDPSAVGKTYTPWGGFLENVDQFDPDFFGISPREALNLDPQQRLLLEVSWEALERAGQSPQRWAGSRTGVYVAIGTADYANLQTRAADLTEIDAYTGMGSGFCFAAGRLSYVLGLQGPNLALDAACASSLMAVHLACQSLRQRECQMALAGGVNLILSPETNITFSKTRMMAADGRCKTFDAAADGYVRSEGCAVVVLKRLSEAIAHRDPILALIRGSAVSHGGASGGLTIPNGAAQQNTIRAALAQAKVEPAQVQYVEAQGTGTPLGDTIEVRALSAVFQQGRSPHDPLWLASVKTNIGHTETASGMASLIKVILALQHQELPPHLHLQQLNPEISLEEIPAKIPTHLTPWTTNSATRLAGVNAFGMSGTNAHAVIEAAPDLPLPANRLERPLHILSLSAKTPRALRELVNRFEQTLGHTPTDRLADLCFTAGAGRSQFKHRLAVVGDTPASIRQQLAAYWATPAPAEPIGFIAPSSPSPKIAFVFTEAPLTEQAGRQLYNTQPTFRQAIDRCVALLQPDSPHRLSKDYPLPLIPQKTALFVLEYALATLWQSWGIVPDGVIGVGVGEVVAACVAGVVSLETALHRVAKLELEGRSQSHFQESGNQESVQPVATCTILCAQTGQALCPTEVLNRLEQPILSLELTQQSLQALKTQGFTHFLEIAPQPSGKTEPGAWLFSLDPHRADWEVLLSSLSQLYQQGATVDWVGFDQDYARQRMPLPTYPFQRQRYWKPSAARGRKAIASISAHPPQQLRLTQAALLSLPVEDRQPRLVADLCDRFAQLLAADPAQITPDRPLNTLALDSLMAIELKLDLETRLGSTIALTELLESDSIATLATRILASLSTTADSLLPAALPQVVPAPGDRHQPFPLNDIQEAYWIGRNGLFEIGNVAAHVYAEFEAVGLDCDRLSRAFQRLIARHDILRAVLLEDGQQQILADVPPYEIAVFDLRHQPVEQVTAELAALRQRSHQMHNPYHWPLFEVCAARLDEQRLRLLLSFDNLLVDAASLSLLCREWGQLYQDLETSLAPLELSFRDYVLALKQFETSETYQRSLHYWQERLPQFPLAPDLPLAVAPSTLKQPRFVRQTTTLAAETWQQLKTRAAQNGLTPSGLLVAAYAEILATWSNRRFSLNLTTFSRLPIHPQVQQIAGDFTSLTLLAVDYSERDGEDTRFAHRAQRLQRQLWQDLEHGYVSGVRVLRELSRVQERSPRVTLPVVFTSLLANPQMKADAFSTGWLGERVYSIAQTPQVWLDHQVYEEAGALVLNWDAVEGLFPAGMVDAMFTAYGRLLHALAWQEETWQQRSLLLTDQTLQESLNATEAPVSEALLQTLFTEQVKLQPDHPAVITAEITLSYEDLFNRAQQLGHRLRQLGVQPNQLVAIAMQKGWEQVVGVLAVLMAGAAYVPIDPGLPEARRGQLLQQGEVHVVLTQPHLQGTVLPPAESQTTPIQLIVVEPLPTAPSEPLEPVQSPTDLAYVIYTSGSTGVPKGVMIDHRGAVNTLLDINQRFGVNPGDRVLALSSLSFDLSVYDIFGTLAAGGTIVMPPAIATKDPAVWAELLVHHQVTIWNSVPALLQMLLTHVADRSEAIPASLRLALLSGDWLPLSLPDQLQAIAPQAQVVSLGGATEASIWSILYPVGQVDPTWKSIPYGRPMTNQRFYVLDERLEPCPVWTPGQLYIGGIGLAQGYWQDQAKTAASFILHPRTGERLYRTGDLGRYLPTGQIEFLGREDHQVKIGGYRIELGEIETTLEQHPEIHQAAVLAVGEPSPQRLVAFVIADETQAAEVFPVVTDNSAEAVARWQAITAAVTKSVGSIAPETETDFTAFSAFWKHLEQLYLQAVGVAFQRLGFFTLGDRPLSPETLLQRSPIQPRYRFWLNRALAQLGDHGWLQRQGNEFRLAAPLPSAISAKLVEQIRSEAAQTFGLSREAIALLIQIAENLADIVTETQHSAEIYLAEAVPEVYQKQFQSSNALLRDIVTQWVNSGQSESLHILEMGAGIGSTTAHLLPVLPPDRTTYVFTDISPYFLQAAQQNFADYPFLQTGLLDLERDPQSQGYSLHQFDLVVAASVLHATRDIAETLDHIRRLLRPGGLLLLLEETQFHPPFDLTMGLQQGFDRFEHDLLRQQHPLLSQAQWQQALLSAGFIDCQVFQPPDPIAAWLGFDVFLVRGPVTVSSFQPQVLQADLAQKLPEYMLPDAYVPLKALPLTANGKVDRRALRSQWQTAQPIQPSSTAYVAPRNAIETAIAMLWQELLKCDRVGIYDNFFERGGDSLLATQVMARIRQMFCVEVPLRNLFQSPTVAALAEAIAQALAAQVDPELLATLAPPNPEPIQTVEPVTSGEK